MAIWHNTALFRIGVAVAAVLVITAACGSNATETTEQLGVDDLATEEEATAETLVGTVVIQTEVTFGDQAGSSTGEWTAVEGADVLGCSTGSLIERETEGGVAAELSCTDGQKDGTFIGLFSPSGAGPTFSSNWDLLVADGEFADMSGTGTWTGEVSPGDAPSVSTIELDVEFGKFATPLTSLESTGSVDGNRLLGRIRDRRWSVRIRNRRRNLVRARPSDRRNPRGRRRSGRMRLVDR